jgi:hypothetical protein
MARSPVQYGVVDAADAGLRYLDPIMTADPGNNTLVTKRQRAAKGGWAKGGWGKGGWSSDRQQSNQLSSNRETVMFHPGSHPGSHPVSHPASQIVCGSCSLCTRRMIQCAFILIPCSLVHHTADTELG